MYEYKIQEGHQYKFSKSKSDLKAKNGGQPTAYVVALTTPQGVTLEQPRTTATSPLPKASIVSSDVSNSTQTGREERQSLIMSTSFIRQ